MCVDVEMCEVDVQGNAEDDVEYVAHLFGKALGHTEMWSEHTRAHVCTCVLPHNHLMHATLAHMCPRLDVWIRVCAWSWSCACLG